jgi:hypothetical protein
MRLTLSRDGRMPVGDVLHLLTVGTSVLLALPAGLAVALFLNGINGALAPGLLVLVSAWAVITRGLVLAADRTVRPWLFDLEQRRHEIVPQHAFATEKETPQDA